LKKGVVDIQFNIIYTLSKHIWSNLNHVCLEIYHRKSFYRDYFTHSEELM